MSDTANTDGPSIPTWKAQEAVEDAFASATGYATDGEYVPRAARNDEIEVDCHGDHCHATLSVSGEGSKFVYVEAEYLVEEGAEPGEPLPVLESFSCPTQSSYCYDIERNSAAF